MTKRTVLLTILFLALLTHLSWGANTHGLGSSDRERQAWWGDGFHPFITSGCAPAVPASSLTIAAFECKGYAVDSGQMYYIDQSSAAITIADATPTWLAIHRDRSTAVSGWTRQQATHYIYKQAAEQPANPAGGLVFAKVTVASNVISDIQLLGATNPTGTVNVRDPYVGATGDPTADDQAALAKAIARIEATGGVIEFPCGTYSTNSANPLITWADTSFVTLRGAGVACTKLENIGAGDIIEVTSSAGVTNIVIGDMQLLGNDTADDLISLQKCSDCVIERVNFVNFKGHGFEHLTAGGSGGVGVTIRDSRFTCSSSSAAGSRAIHAQNGVGWFVANNYFNMGSGACAGAVDVNGASDTVFINNKCDGVAKCYDVGGPGMSIGDHFDSSASVTTAINHTGNVSFLVFNPSGIATSGFTTNATDPRSLSVVGINNTSQEFGVIGGAISAAELTITDGAPGDDYNPSSDAFRYSSWIWTPAADRTFTSITNGFPGRVLFITNDAAIGSGFELIFEHAATTGTDANKILTPDGLDIRLQPQSVIRLIYDGDDSRWRVTPNSTNRVRSLAFSSLGTPDNGTLYYCTDCKVATAANCDGAGGEPFFGDADCECAGSGSGAFARRAQGAWYCH